MIKHTHRDLRITVIIPTYNRLQKLKIAVASALEASEDTLVHILDNDSTDGTREWLESQEVRLNERIEVTLQPYNIGSIPNFMAGFSAVRTEYLVPLSDDDMLLPGFLSAALQIADEYKDVCAVIGDVEIGEYGQWRAKSKPTRLVGYVTPANHISELLSKGHYIAWSAVLWRTAPILNEQIYETAISFALSSDVYLEFASFMRRPAYIIDVTAARFTISDTQTSRGIGSDARSFEDLGRLAQRLTQDLKGAGLGFTDTSIRSLVSKSVSRWCDFARRNRAFLSSEERERTLSECMQAFSVYVLPHCRAEDWPFSDEIRALQRKKETPLHRKIINRIAKHGRIGH
jgi:glycosyltransferase involved in cell wall biosynthesis